MRFTIVTPSYGQLDWLKLCVASVRDQVATRAETGNLSLSAGQAEAAPEFSIEHIVQDAGTPGIEEFARQMGAGFYQDGKRVFGFQCSVDGEFVGAEDTKVDSAQCTSWSPRRPVSSNLGSVDGESVGAEGESVESKGYSLTIYSEKDEGMYDAINKGLRKATGDICAYLNCDEQYLPRTLRWVADYLSVSPETQVLFGAAIVTRADGSYVCDRRVMVPGDWHTRVSGNLSFFTAATFFRNALVSRDKLYFDTAWKALGDAVWGLSLLKARVSMTAVDRPLAIHTDTGNNLILSDMAIREKAQLEATASPLVAKAKKLIIFLYRLRRFIGGSYFLVPHQYQIYTVEAPEHRKTFTVNKPTHHWSGR